MPDIGFIVQYLPAAPLHPVNIAHYLVILLGFAILGSAQEDSPPVLLLMAAVMAMLAVADLYINFFALDTFVIFLIRLGMFTIPIALAGFAPSGSGSIQGLAVFAAICGFGILVMSFVGCGFPAFASPQTLYLCQ